MDGMGLCGVHAMWWLQRGMQFLEGVLVQHVVVELSIHLDV